MWMSTPGLGLPILFNFLRTVDTSLYPLLITLLQQTAPSWGAAEIRQLFSFIIGSHVREQVRSELLDLVIQLWTHRVICVDLIRGHDGFEYIMSLLDCSSESLRCSAIRLLGLMLDDVKCQKAFTKVCELGLECCGVWGPVGVRISAFGFGGQRLAFVGRHQAQTRDREPTRRHTHTHTRHPPPPLLNLCRVVLRGAGGRVRSSEQAVAEPRVYDRDADVAVAVGAGKFQGGGGRA